MFVACMKIVLFNFFFFHLENIIKRILLLYGALESVESPCAQPKANIIHMEMAKNILVFSKEQQCTECDKKSSDCTA